MPNHHRLTLLSAACLGASLFAAAMPAWAAGAKAGTPAMPAALGAAGQAADAQQLGRELLTRSELEKMGLRLIGVATFGGQTSCFLRVPGTAAPQTFEQGQMVGDFRIVEIGTETITLERDGVRVPLTLSSAVAGPATQQVATAPADGPEMASGADVGDELDPATSVQQEIDELTGGDGDTTETAIEVKAPRKDLKTLTASYSGARIVQDGWNVKTSRKTTQVASATRVSGAPQFDYPIHGKKTSDFGYRRHPMGGGYRMHNGVDLAAPYGTTVRAAAGGVVSQVGYNSSYGRYIFIRHSNGWETRYGHLSAQTVKEGERVTQGEAIGREGSTGLSTGPHLHFEVRKDGRPLNPLFYLDK